MTDLLKNLNPEQYAAATHVDGPLLIIAGAGSGKTHTLISRVTHLIDIGVRPESILLLTFTNQAANEMKARAVASSDERCGRIVACTFHSFCAEQLRRYANLIDLSRAFTIMSSSDVTDAIQYVKASQGDKYKKLKGFPPAKAIASIISGACNKMISIEEYMMETESKYMGFVVEIKEIAKLYKVYKQEHDVADYDDLLVLFDELLQKNEKARRIISGTYEYIMVDEYQDTNALQERILLLLRKDNDNIAVVGDDAQSIYGFRGANVENILHFPELFPGCKTVSLVTNYRSNDEIVQLSNHVINEHIVHGYEKHMNGTYDAGRLPVVMVPRDEYMEARSVFYLINKHNREGTSLHEIAVLARASSSMYRLETLLTEYGVGYEKRGGIKFLEHACVVDIISYLKCLVNPSDHLAWFHVMKLHPHIGDTYSSRISEDCLNNREFLLSSRHIKKSFADELRILDKHMKIFAACENFNNQVSTIIEFYIELRERCIEMAKVDDESARTQMQSNLEDDKLVLDTLKAVTAKYDSATAFLDAIVLDAAQSPTGDVEDPLVLSTIHSAKGLEFDVVFVLGCSDGLFPKSLSPDPEADEEELRCFYVAITRAKKHLYIMCPNGIVLNGRFSYAEQTRFLDGCDEYFSYQ